MTASRGPALDTLLKEMLQDRTSVPDALLADQIVRSVTGVAQRRSAWSGLFSGRLRLVTILGLTILLIAALLAIAVAGARLLERSRLPVAVNGSTIAIDFTSCRLIGADTTLAEPSLTQTDPWDCPTGVESNPDMGFNAAWSRDGKVLVWSAVRFCGACVEEPDPEDLALSGIWVREEGKSSRQIARCGIDFCGGLDISPDGGRVAFARGGFGTGRETLVIVDLAGNVIGTSDQTSNVTEPHFSPDGSRIAFTTVTNAGSSLMTVDANGEDPRVIVTRSARLHPLEWSSDGASIAVLSRENGRESVVKLDISTGAVEAVAAVSDEPGFDGVVDFDLGPDPDRLLLTTYTPTESGVYPVDVAVMNFRDGHRMLLHRFDCCVDVAGVTWSPDGRWIAVALTSAVFQDELAGLYVMHADGTGLRRVADIQSSGFSTQTVLSWQPLSPGSER